MGGKSRTFKEDQLQAATSTFLRAAYPNLIAWHTENERKCSPQAGARSKAKGKLAGVPDWCFVLREGRHGFIELKVGNNRLTDGQVRFREAVEAIGCPYEVARSLDEFIAILEQWERENLV